MPKPVEFSLPERSHLRSLCASDHLCVIEGLRRIHNPNVSEIIEKNQIAKIPLLFLRDGRQHHVKFSGGRSLYKDSILVHHPPDETGTVKTLNACCTPAVAASEILLDCRFYAFHKAPLIRCSAGWILPGLSHGKSRDEEQEAKDMQESASFDRIP